MPTRHATLPPRLFPAAVLTAAVILAGCGGASQRVRLVAASRSPIVNAGAAESALKRLKAPPGFRLATCKFLKKAAYTRCYRRAGFVPLSPAKLAALITSSGLAPTSNTVACPRYIRARSNASYARDYCEARAAAASVEFDAFATSIRFRRGALKPSERKIAATLSGTVFELAVVATEAHT
jgi:hypothetical protein